MMPTFLIWYYCTRSTLALLFLSFFDKTFSNELHLSVYSHTKNRATLNSISLIIGPHLSRINSNVTVAIYYNSRWFQRFKRSFQSFRKENGSIRVSSDGERYQLILSGMFFNFTSLVCFKTYWFQFQTGNREPWECMIVRIISQQSQCIHKSKCWWKAMI